MAILAIFTGNTTKDEYDRLLKEVDWKRNWAPGAMLHVASFDDAGRIHVADVWESAEQLNAFVEQRLMPAVQKLGLNPPNVEVYPTHNIDSYSSLSQYQRG
jgi:hypothetical protein